MNSRYVGIMADDIPNHQPRTTPLGLVQVASTRAFNILCWPATTAYIHPF